jgi:tripartite-type tricarboxylate transporter receptor subunit TctC
MQRRHFLASIAGTATLFGGLSASAQASYPAKPLRFIVPYAAGGFPDTVARIIGLRLGERLGQSIVIDNRPGANGVVAAQALASAGADGYSFLVTDGSMFSINPLIYKSLSYDPKKDFMPVALLARAPLFLAVHPKIPADTFAEFVALAKSKPGELTYGSSGIGSTHHLCTEAMKAALGIDIRHIPFKGTAQSVPALIGGQVDCAFSALPSLQGFVKANQVKLLAVNSAKRYSLTPQLPAIAETIPGFDFAPTVGILATAGTPSAVIVRIAAEVAQVARMQAVIDTMNTAGIEVGGAGPAEYAKAILSESEHMARAVQVAQLKPE